LQRRRKERLNWKSFAPPILLRMVDDEKKKTKKKDNTSREKETKTC
jgi:hypothetical protein|tara:strand:- start:155 stop:292 length:138 start_codon:yes stop_codon:yes gene_type:complete